MFHRCALRMMAVVMVMTMVVSVYTAVSASAMLGMDA